MGSVWSDVKRTLRAEDRGRRTRDYLFGRLLFALPQNVRARLFAGTAHTCPVCNSNLRTFLVLYRPYHLWCPVCRSLARHRFVWLLFNDERFALLPEAGPPALLHVAPEPGLEAHLKRLAQRYYVSTDLFDPHVTVRADLCALPFSARAFDLILCSHVLEHVADDAAALAEIYRLLSRDGTALILVPIVGEVTEEDLTLTSPAERERRFGQHDHVRRYGSDFTAKLAQTGFDVTTVAGAEVLQDGEAERYGIRLNEPVFLCRRRLDAA